jgi:hypothetical protein
LAKRLILHVLIGADAGEFLPPPLTGHEGHALNIVTNLPAGALSVAGCERPDATARSRPPMPPSLVTTFALTWWYDRSIMGAVINKRNSTTFREVR